MNYLDLLELGEKVNNYISDATDNGTGNDKFDSTILMEYEVPSGKKWIVIGGIVNRDVSSTMSVRAYNSSDEIIHQFISEGAATGITTWPHTTGTTGNMQGVRAIILDEGDYVKLTFGTAQGASAEASCVVVEVDI